MRVGHGEVDITPKRPLTLSGFASRCNQPSEGISDPIFARALVVENENQWVAQLSFDLLGLGGSITEAIHSRLDAIPGCPISRERRVLACTHTHSAPATVRLIGCGIEEPWYTDVVVEAAARAVEMAVESVQCATMRYCVRQISGANYNRRQVLSDGRVSMSGSPDLPVVRVGPLWDRMTLVRFDDERGDGIAGIAHWAGHACTVGDNYVSADYPGELCRRLADRHGMPFHYLQGACGNLNPPLGKMTRQDMLGNVKAMVEQLADLQWSPPVDPTPFGFLQGSLDLRYGAVPTPEEAAEIGRGMRKIAESGTGPDGLLAVLSDIMNVEPGTKPDEAMLRHIAGALAEWSESLDGKSDAVCPMSVAVWRMGPLAWCFAAAEVFAETAIRVQREFPDLVANIVGYGAPLVGYLPTDEALSEGGYEVDYAHRFYGHPGPFSKGSEPALVDWIRDSISLCEED